jgi:foldase protein PrsA
MKLRKSILALGAFFAVAAGIAGCGSSVPGNSVADVAGNPITTQAFNHWMYVAAKGNAEQSGGSAPVIVPTDPPTFTSCIAEARKEISSVAKQTNAQLRSECSTLFTSLSSQVMDFLIRSYWYQADAAKQHVTVTPAQVQQQFALEKNSQFPTAAEFQSFLSESGYTMEDLLFRTKVQLIYNKLLAKVTKPISSADIANYYAAHKSQYGKAETRNLRIVLTKTQSQAQAALTALKAGQSWNAVAKKYSIDPTTKDKGGALNGVSKGGEDAALEAAAFSAPVNKLVGPVKGQFGYYIVEVTKITPGTQKSLAQATSQIRSTLTQQQQTNAQNTVDKRVKQEYGKQTTCRSAYAMTDCSGYKAPKGSTTTPTTSP